MEGGSPKLGKSVSIQGSISGSDKGSQSEVKRGNLVKGFDSVVGRRATDCLTERVREWRQR
eukprot:3508939-Prorocentrum_lima.AAC.1